MGDLQDLLNTIEKKRSELNRMALCMELTSEDVVKSSRELDKLLNEVYRASKQAND